MFQDMPSLLHEGLLALVRDRPEFVVELLRDVFGVDTPQHRTVRVAEGSFTELIPVEYRSDLVLIAEADRAVYGLILEAQLKPDERKRFTWPHYVTSARARFECEFAVIVVTPDRSTARWAAQPVELGGGNPWRPLVLGPDWIPLVTDLEQACRSPELTILSALAHGGTGRASTQELALAVLVAVGSLTEEQRMVCLGLVEPVLGEAVRKALNMIPPHLQKVVRESWKRLAAPEIAEAVAEARADAVLRVLERRGLAITADERERISTCQDRAVIDAWLDRAVTATTTAELFEPSPK